MEALTHIIGHHRIQEVLSRMLEHQTLPHALLFIGPEGVGKTTLAHTLSQVLLSHSGSLHTHPDFVELNRLVDEKTGKRKSLISVEQIRELNNRLALSSLSGGWKIAFLEEAGYLSIAGANALLKTLEEPKGQTLFILRATSLGELPETIVSRCQILRFTLVSRKDIEDGLVMLGFSRADARTASVQALGRPGYAIRFLRESDVRAHQETSMAQALAFFSAPLPERLKRVTELVPKSEIQKDEALLKILDQWELLCRDVLLEHLGRGDVRVFPDEARLRSLVPVFPPTTLLSLLDRIARVRAALRHHINPHLALEHIALGFHTL